MKTLRRRNIASRRHEQNDDYLSNLDTNVEDTRELRCGSNLAYLFNCRALTTVGNETIADGVHARVLVRVLASCDTLLKQRSRGSCAEESRGGILDGK